MRLEKFMEVVRKIPPTWTCLVCKDEHSNAPGGEMPEAYKTTWVERGKQIVLGHICKRCFYGRD